MWNWTADGLGGDPHQRTCVDSLVARKVPLVAESSLAAVTLVWLVAVHLKHVLFEGLVLGELGVTFIAEERPVFCSGGETTAEDQNPNQDMLSVVTLRYLHVDKTHRSWSPSIPSAIPPCPLSDGTWRCWDRPLSAAGRACRKMNSSGGLSSAERGFRCS